MRLLHIHQNVAGGRYDKSVSAWTSQPVKRCMGAAHVAQASMPDHSLALLAIPSLSSQSRMRLQVPAPGSVAERLGQAAFIDTSDMGQAALSAAAAPGGIAAAAVQPAGALTSNLAAVEGPMPASALATEGAAVPVPAFALQCYSGSICMQAALKQTPSQGAHEPAALGHSCNTKLACSHLTAQSYGGKANATQGADRISSMQAIAKQRADRTSSMQAIALPAQTLPALHDLPAHEVLPPVIVPLSTAAPVTAAVSAIAPAAPAVPAVSGATVSGATVSGATASGAVRLRPPVRLNAVGG